MTNSLRDVLFRRFDGVGEGFADRQVCGEGRGERTAGAMGVRRVDPFAFVHAEEPAVIQQIGGGAFQQMSAFDQDVLAAELVKRLRCLPGFGQRPDRQAGEPFGLMDIGRDDGSQGNEGLLHRINRVVLQQVMPAFGHHDGIDDNPGHVVLLQLPGDQRRK